MKKIILSLVAIFLVSSCASTPKPDAKLATLGDAKTWFPKYCSKLGVSGDQHELIGSLVMRAHTNEFKGQYPASVHFDPNGSFQLEMTSIIGGTLAQLLGNSQSLEVVSPSKPRYNRKGITHYLGLEANVLAQLLHGDLPCPLMVTVKKVSVESSHLVMETENWKWIFDRASKEDQEVPVKLTLIPTRAAKPIEMQIENWDIDRHYAKKVSVVSAEGDLRWTWRSRELK